MIGTVIIKHKLSLSDSETVQQIQENSYMQFFVGMVSFQMEPPFVSSLLVDIIKRMGQSVFDVFEQAIIEAHDGEKEKPQTKATSDTDNEERQTESAHEHSERDPKSQSEETEKETITHQGKLILDATVVEQAIRYPTDLSLLNEARELSEKIIDQLYPHTELTKKPRTYREKARSAFFQTKTPEWKKAPPRNKTATAISSSQLRPNRTSTELLA